jgi:hypothetical protein
MVSIPWHEFERNCTEYSRSAGRNKRSMRLTTDLECESSSRQSPNSQHKFIQFGRVFLNCHELHSEILMFETFEIVPPWEYWPLIFIVFDHFHCSHFSSYRITFGSIFIYCFSAEIFTQSEYRRFLRRLYFYTKIRFYRRLELNWITGCPWSAASLNSCAPPFGQLRDRILDLGSCFSSDVHDSQLSSTVALCVSEWGGDFLFILFLDESLSLLAASPRSIRGDWAARSELFCLGSCCSIMVRHMQGPRFYLDASRTDTFLASFPPWFKLWTSQYGGFRIDWLREPTEWNSKTVKANCFWCLIHRYFACRNCHVDKHTDLQKKWSMHI